MSSISPTNEPAPSSRSAVHLYEPTEADGIAWLPLKIDVPGRYLICLPTEDQASALQQDRPHGLLKRIDGRPLWIEPRTN